MWKVYKKSTAYYNVVKGKFDFLSLSPNGYHLAALDGRYFFVDKDGKEVGNYVDCSNYTAQGYALVIKEDGMAYLVDEMLNEITTGYYADSVYSLYNGLVIIKDGQKTYFVFDK